MTATPNQLIDSPENTSDKGTLLDNVLASVRLTGAIFLRGEYTAPWAYESPPSSDLVGILGPRAERLILFHVIAEGECWIRSITGHHLELSEGDVVVLPYGDAHVMGGREVVAPVPIASLMPPPPWDEFSVIEYGGGGERTAVVCGYLHCEDPIFHPIVRALPPMFSVTPSGPAAAWVASSVQYALDASRGSMAHGTLARRLPELLFLEVLRLYVESVGADASGWLAALQDEVVGRALVELHADAAQKWTAYDLAARVACSRSTLNERFAKLLGRAPMQYLAEWRVQLAAGLLRETGLAVRAIAYRVGYESEEAFNRAFKRAMGAPPAQWRTNHRS